MRRSLTLAALATLSLAACSPAAPPERQAAASTQPPAPTPVRTPAQELGLVGAWRGTATQTDGASYRMLLRVNATGGASRYPTFNCGGRLVPTGREGRTVVYRETLTYGAASEDRRGCASGGRVSLTLTDEGLSWVWDDAPGFPTLVARATLQREGATAPQ